MTFAREGKEKINNNKPPHMLNTFYSPAKCTIELTHRPQPNKSPIAGHHFILKNDCSLSFMPKYPSFPLMLCYWLHLLPPYTMKSKQEKINLRGKLIACFAN